MMPPESTTVALWCLIGKDQVLMTKSNVAALDRAALLLPRFETTGTAKADRNAIEEFLAAAGLNSTRQPVTPLGAPLVQAHGLFQKIKLYAVALPAGPVTLPDALSLLPLTGASLPDNGRTEHIDALFDCAAYRYFSLATTGSRPMDSEIFASIPVHSLRDDYLNFWFPDALRELEPLGILIDIDATEAHQPILRISGRSPLTASELDTIRSRLVDLGRHARGRFWVTEILEGNEALIDYADPATAGKIARGSLS